MIQSDPPDDHPADLSDWDCDDVDSELAQRVLTAAILGTARAALERSAERRHRRLAQVAAAALVCVLAGGLWVGIARTPGPQTSSSVTTSAGPELEERCREMVLRHPGTESDAPARCVGLAEFLDIAINGQCEVPTDAVQLIRETIRAIGLVGWDVRVTPDASANACAIATLNEDARTVTISSDSSVRQESQ